jgi:tripartite-type tricarboxylate transporter receptor subunit TctC
LTTQAHHTSRQHVSLGIVAVLVAVSCTRDVRPAVTNPESGSSGSAYPTRPVRLVEPFGAGGGLDVVARAISPTLSELWSQPVRVENHPGGAAPRLPRWSHSRRQTATHCS